MNASAIENYILSQCKKNCFAKDICAKHSNCKLIGSSSISELLDSGCYMEEERSYPGRTTYKLCSACQTSILPYINYLEIQEIKNLIREASNK